MRATFYPKARTENLIVQNVADETLVYDLTTHKAHCLNETAAFVWSKCSGDASVEDMVRFAESRFGQPVDTDVVKLAIAQLQDRQLLSESSAPNGSVLPSRREAIKRLGLASAIALPVIASLVSSTAAGTSSACACVVPGDCAAQPCPNPMNCNGSGMCAPNL
jgi:hypothetical protein